MRKSYIEKSYIEFSTKLPSRPAFLLPESFVRVWQSSQSLDEVHVIVEKAWRESIKESIKKRGEEPRTFWKSRISAMRQLRGRATKYRKKGVELNRLQDEELYATKSGKCDWKALANLANDLGSESNKYSRF